MLQKMHRCSEELAASAKTALEDKDYEKAHKLFAEAASFEEQAFDGIPKDKVKTRSILAVSLAALLYKSKQFEKAEFTIYKLLGTESLQPFAIAQLRELLQVVCDERLLSDIKQCYSGESITVALRGGEIGAGTGPLDLILEKAAGFRSIIYRFAEWMSKYPLRLSGKPPKELTDLIQARVAEPALGSYQLEIRLTEPIQEDFFQKSLFNPAELSDAIFDFYDQLTTGDPNQIEKMIPQPEYRKAFLQLTNNIAPRGKRVREIGLYRTRNKTLQKVYLTDALPERVKKIIPKPQEQDKQKEYQLSGNLRAVHLDENWLELTLSNEAHEKCFTLPDMLDEVVGPMVNRKVIVKGPRIRRGKGEPLLVHEIEPSEDE